MGVKNSSSSMWFPYRCRDCGSEISFTSRPRNFGERYLLPIFLLRPAQCGECYRRDYHSIFSRAKEREI